jgi:hypothetical protein
MPLIVPPSPEPVYKTYDGVLYEVLPVSNFVSSPLVSTTSELLASIITPEDEEHDERVARAKHARSKCINPSNVNKWMQLHRHKKNTAA